MTSLSRGRPSIAESELPQNIKIALANRVTGKTWKACAAEAGIAYSTLRDWLRKRDIPIGLLAPIQTNAPGV